MISKNKTEEKIRVLLFLLLLILLPSFLGIFTSSLPFIKDKTSSPNFLLDFLLLPGFLFSYILMIFYNPSGESLLLFGAPVFGAILFWLFLIIFIIIIARSKIKFKKIFLMLVLSFISWIGGLMVFTLLKNSTTWIPLLQVSMIFLILITGVAAIVYQLYFKK